MGREAFVSRSRGVVVGGQSHFFISMQHQTTFYHVSTVESGNAAVQADIFDPNPKPNCPYATNAATNATNLKTHCLRFAVTVDTASSMQTISSHSSSPSLTLSSRCRRSLYTSHVLSRKFQRTAREPPHNRRIDATFSPPTLVLCTLLALTRHTHLLENHAILFGFVSPPGLFHVGLFHYSDSMRYRHLFL